MTRETDVFRLVHAGHDVTEVGVVVGNSANPPLICWTCHEEQHGYDDGLTGAPREPHA